MSNKPDLRVVKEKETEDWGRSALGRDIPDQEELEREWLNRLAALADKPRPRINRSRAMETLPCRFSDSERADMTREMILANQERESREKALEDLKDEKKRLEGFIKEADKTISATLKSLDRGFEDRSVEVEKIVNYTDGLVTYFRLDTGEEIRTRPLNESERQMPLVA